MLMVIVHEAYNDCNVNAILLFSLVQDFVRQLHNFDKIIKMMNVTSPLAWAETHFCFN